MSNEYAHPARLLINHFLFAVEPFHFLNRARPVYHQSDQ